MRLLNLLIKSFLFFLLILQYFMCIIFQSDIPMNIQDGDIIIVIIIAFFIQLITLSFIIINRKDKNDRLLIIFVLSLIIWILDTVHLIRFEGYKEYILNVIGIYTTVINIIYIFALKSVAKRS